MGRKRVVKIPRRANVKCPKCSAINRLNVPEENIINFFQCKNCKEIISTPASSCCIICAFSDKKCPLNLKIEAKAKNLEIRYPEKKKKSTKFSFRVGELGN